MPSSSFVSRKFGIEVNNNDVDISRLFTECRVGMDWGVKLPATGMATTDIGLMGRDMEIYSGANGSVLYLSNRSHYTASSLRLMACFASAEQRSASSRVSISR
jgi:hypothetical protein